MSVSSSSSATYNVFNALGIKTNGIGGLASGMDTDSLVQSMTISTRSRIATQQQKKQTLLWKQSAYRNVASALTTFQNKYFTYSNKGTSNILSGEFFNVYKAIGNNDAVTVSGGNSIVNFDIAAVHQLATNQYVTQTDKFSTPLTGGDASTMTGSTIFTDETLTLQVNGTTKTIKLDSLNGKASATAIKNELQDLLNEAFGKYNDGRLIVKVDLDGSDNLVLSSEYSTIYVPYEGSNVLGFKQGASNKVDMDTKVSELLFAGGSLSGDVYKFKINGAEITVNSTDTISKLRSNINNSTANVTLAYDPVKDEFRLTSKLSGGGNFLEVEDTQGNLMNLMFGSKGGGAIGAKNLIDSNPIDGINVVDFTSMSEREIQSYLKTVKETSFKVTIDGVSYTVKADEALINAEIAAGSAASFTNVVAALNVGLDDALGSSPNSYFQFVDNANTIQIQLGSDGVNSEITLTNSSTSTDLLAHLGFGSRVTNIVDATDTALLGTLTLAEIGVTFTGPGPYEIYLDDGVTTPQTISILPTDTIDDLMQNINAAYPSGDISADIVDGRIVISSKNGDLRMTSDGNTNVLNRLFGVVDGTGLNAGYQTKGENYLDSSSNSRMISGQNAELTVYDDDDNPMRLSYANNSFSLYGVNITLNEVFNHIDNDSSNTYPTEIADSSKTIKIRTENDPDDVIDRLKEFLDEYNAMIELINSYIYEEKNSDFSPLSDEQKAELSTSEIEKVEAEAKKGILRSDNTLRSIVQQFRTAVYTTVEAAGIAGYSIGITTMNITNSTGVNQLDNGKLEISEKGEATLRNALLNNPDMVREFFINSEDGLSVRFNNIITTATNASSDPELRGTLVRLAGTSNITGDNTSVIGNQIEMIDKTLSTLKLRLEKEYNRYWQQFTRLEVALQNLSSQSSWLYDYAAS